MSDYWPDYTCYGCDRPMRVEAVLCDECFDTEVAA